ncbi:MULTISPECIES: PepSY-associated TM helix domain-containing protein [unclassified Afipia]|uniref:PepSY-associated TM helix domain-containing protein n=1 Tax=unclassified Afipia TaxID=2642050 RepID=UPI00041F9690|nr:MULTISPECIES: PepSY-associated TM helix domain-containing protein [unclassified Afipia]
MPTATSIHRRGSLKRLWRNIHLWLGIGLFILLVPVALSGAVLVYHDDIGEYLSTPRGAVVPSKPTDLTLAIANARKAAGDGFTPMSISFPEDNRVPLTIALRGPAAKGERPVRLTATIDRHDARVLSIVDYRQTFFGFMHVFHENLTIPDYGRSIVGWTGVAMLTLSLTGLYLWWPRHGQWSRAFVWRRSPATSSNLHYMTGFWICFPLTLISLTGIYLAWPQQGRELLSSVAPMTEQQRGGPRAQVMANTARSPAEIFATASARSNSAVDAISYPNPQTGAWRVRLREDGKTEPVTILINDRSGDVSVVQPLSGDWTASWIRWLHEGSHSGEIWRFVVFLSGIMPAVLGVTGILIWLRQRRQRALIKRGGPQTTAKTPPQSVGSAAPAE